MANAPGLLYIQEVVVTYESGSVTLGDYLLDYEHLFEFWWNGKLRFDWLGETPTETLAGDDETRTASVTGPGTIATLGWARVMPPGFPAPVFKLDAIQDGFAELDDSGNPALDTEIWNASFPLDHIALSPLGTAAISASPAATILGATTYDLTESLISAQISPITGSGLDGSQVTQFYVQDTNDAANYAMIALSSTTFYCQHGDDVAGTNTTKVLGTYDANGDAYWQLSETGGVISFWSSADGENWTLLYSVRPQWTPDNVGLFIAATYDVDEAQTVLVTSLNGNVVTPSSTGGIYLGEPVMGVWMQQLNAARQRGTVPFVTTRMDGTRDSYGNPWQDSMSLQVQNGTDLYTLLQNHAAVLNADWIMEPGFDLRVGLPLAFGGNGVSLGVDRSKQVVLRESRHATVRQRVRARDQVQNLYGAVNSDGTVVVAQDSDSIIKYQQREGWVQTAQAVNIPSMDIVVAAAVQETKDEVLSQTISVIMDAPGAVVFDDYNVGDWVGLERPGIGASTVDAVRVVGIGIEVGSDGAATCELTINTYRQWLQQQFQYLVNKFGAQFITQLGAVPVTNALGPTSQPGFGVSPSLGGLSDVSTGTNHQDPLVYNAFTGRWQNASAAGPSGTPLGMTIGDPSGSQVAMMPAVGNTVLVDAGSTLPMGTILSAFQVASNASSETTPGYTCAVIFHQGAANEQLGHLTVSGQGSGGVCQGVLMTSESADGTIHSSVRHGEVVPGGGGTTFAFNTMTAIFPHSGQMQMSEGFGLFGTEAGGGGSAAPWTSMTPLSNSFSSGGSSTEYTPQYRYSPLHNGVLFFRGIVVTPNAGSVNGITWGSVAALRQPVNTCRWPVMPRDDPSAGLGFATLGEDGNIHFEGIPADNNSGIDITGAVHIGSANS